MIPSITNLLEEIVAMETPVVCMEEELEVPLVVALEATQMAEVVIEVD